jgi:beta-1,2-mannobiose phosphorylase / 1,2-beta-oligomannan phosphorylase
MAPGPRARLLTVRRTVTVAAIDKWAAPSAEERKRSVLKRLFTHCVVTPEDMPVTDDRLEVIGAFNPAVAEVDGEVLLLVRVAESLKEKRDGRCSVPRFEPGRALHVEWLEDRDLTYIDPRVVHTKKTILTRLTFVSHLRLVRCGDGRRLEQVDDVAIYPECEEEEFGLEDPRITKIDDTYYITYVAVSRHGIATALASTRDFKSFERHGIIFPPQNKDVLLFPETIDGNYYALHRPDPAAHFSPPEMWVASSSDLIHWGRHEPLHGGGGEWELSRVGGGVPPFRVDGGWLEIYHGNTKVGDPQGVGRYSAAALLLDADNPREVLKRTREPIMVPEADFERQGFIHNVVFPTGAVERDDILQVHYGAADTFCGVVEFSKHELLDALE